MRSGRNIWKPGERGREGRLLSFCHEILNKRLQTLCSVYVFVCATFFLFLKCMSHPKSWVFDSIVLCL